MINITSVCLKKNVCCFFLLSVPSLPPIDETNLPLSSLLKSFDLQVVMARCDIRSISLILRCMPSLHRFVFTLLVDQNISPFIMDLINGKNWQVMLTTYVPYLNQFDFHISLITNGEPTDFNEILDSFRCFSKLYYQWQMAINRWKINPYLPCKSRKISHLYICWGQN